MERSKKFDVIYTKTYLLSLVIRSINDFSQAYIFTVLMPLITSLMVVILSSVRAAVLLLRGQTWEMSLSDHILTFCSSSSRGHREGSEIKWFPTALLCWHHRQVVLKVQMEKKTSRKSTIRRTCSISQGRPEVSQIQTICPRWQWLSRKGRKESNRKTVSVL